MSDLIPNEGAAEFSRPAPYRLWLVERAVNARLAGDENDFDHYAAELDALPLDERRHAWTHVNNAVADREAIEFGAPNGDTPRTFPGLTHREALDLDVPPVRQLVAGLVEAGTLGTIAGLPETHKSFLALELAFAVARERGTVLGRDIVQGGPVGYFWQDDGLANEAARVQEFARRRELTGDLPIRWHLNEDLRLPDDLDALRDEIERERQVLVVLDSLYNFLAGITLKDEDVAAVLARLKAGVVDPTGCTIAIVDHAPWPTDGNRGQRRAYGSVFKAAAIRWSIFLEREGDTLWGQAGGNNLPGLDRSILVWNADELGLHVFEPPTPTATEDIAARVADYLERNPGATTTTIRAAVPGNDAKIDAVLDTDERFVTVPPVLFGKPRNAKCWALADHAPGLLTNVGQESGRGSADVAPGDQPTTSAEQPTTPEGGEVLADVGRHTSAETPADVTEGEQP